MPDRFVNRQIYQAYSNKYSINTTGNNATGRKAYSPQLYFYDYLDRIGCKIKAGTVGLFLFSF